MADEFMPQWRTTVTYVKSGQARAYADHVDIVRVLFEGPDYKNRCLAPIANLVETYVRERLLTMHCGFTEFVPDPGDHSMDTAFRKRLDYLRETEPGVWQFQTTTRFTD
jgi:hypothetical protein